MLDSPLRRGAEDAAFGQRDENGAVVFAREGGGYCVDCIDVRLLLRAGQSGQLGGVHFENDGWEIS